MERDALLEPDREAAAPEPAPPQAAPAAHSPALAQVLGLQRSAGNAAVSRMLLQRDDVPDGSAFDTARHARQAWIDGGVRGPENYQASTGRGGFQVAYVPEYMAMNATLKGGVEFTDGITLYMGVVAVANQTTAPVVAAAQAINSAPIAQRAGLVAAWQWNDAEKAKFLTDFEAAVRGVWHRDYEFHCTKQYWEDLGSVVNVFVDVHAGANNPEDHMRMTTYKIASGQAAGGVGVVNSYAGQSQTNTMTLNSTDVTPRTDIMLTEHATFQAGSDNFAAGGNQGARLFGFRYVNQGGPRCATCGQEIAGLAGTAIHVRVQGSGPDPQANASARFTKLTTEMASTGMTDAATRCVYEYDGEGDGATMVVGEGAQQIVAAHESGHMFGLGDEYTAPFSGTGRAPGSNIDATIGPDQGLPGAVAENTDSIMSVGNAVKPQHYATFLEALKHVTGMAEWAFGPANGVLPPGVDGPLPQPGTGVPGGQPGQPQPQPDTAVV